MTTFHIALSIVLGGGAAVVAEEPAEPAEPAIALKAVGAPTDPAVRGVAATQGE